MKEIKIDKIELMKIANAKQKILYWFFSFPTCETGLNDLASDLEISKVSAKKAIEILIEEEFLNKKVYGKAWRITCNPDHVYNFSSKVSFNLELVSQLYFLELRKLILEKIGTPKSVSLFGSYRKGDDTKKSDLDIAIEISGSNKAKIIELGNVQKLGHRSNVKVNAYVYSRKNVDINLFSNIANGIVLEGFLEVKPE